MSQNCRAIALAEYTLQVQAQQYVNLYHQILKKQGRTLLISVDL
jgi:hypothetical protein